MKTPNAAGRKTDFEPPPRFTDVMLERHVDTQLAALTRALCNAFARCEAIPEGRDEFGNVRSAEFAAAVRLAEASANLIQAVGKMRGRFNHDITVTRNQQPAAEPFDQEPQEKEVPLFTRAELQTLTEVELMREIPIRKARHAAEQIKALREARERLGGVRGLEEFVDALEEGERASKRAALEARLTAEERDEEASCEALEGVPPSPN